MKLTKTFTFSAAHRLEHYEGKCVNLHGHTWKVEVMIDAFLSSQTKMDVDMLLDFVEITKIRELFDHTYLNNIINITPTAENLAAIICLIMQEKITKQWDNLERNVLVKLWESDTSMVCMDIYDAQLWLNPNPTKSIFEQYFKRNEEPVIMH